MSSLTREQLLPLFDKHLPSCEKRAGGMTTVERIFDSDKDDAVIRKCYSGALSGMQKREAGLLFEVAATSVKLGDQRIPMKDRIAGLSTARALTLEPSVQITLRWHGFDLDDWGKLLGVEESPMTDATFVLAVMRAALKALQLMHEVGYVHGDVKADNFCLNFAQLDPRADGTRGVLQPNTLKLIDLGMTTSADHRDAKQWPNLGDFGLQSKGDPARKGDDDLLVQAYAAAKNLDWEQFKAIDWRYDLWALGWMLWRWPGFRKGQMRGKQQLTTQLSYLQRQLVEIYDFGDTVATQKPPHAKLIEDIDKAIGPVDTDWHFHIPDRIGAIAAVAPPTIVPGRPPPQPRRLKGPLAGIAALVLAATAWSIYNADSDRGSPPLAASPVPTAPAITGTQALFDALERQTARSGLRVQARPERSAYAIGQALAIDVTSPIDGHLALLFADEGVTWPVVHTGLTTQIRAGQTVHFPDGIEVLAAAPTGRMRWIAVVTASPVDWAAQFATGSLQTQLLAGVAASNVGELAITP